MEVRKEKTSVTLKKVYQSSKEKIKDTHEVLKTVKDQDELELERVPGHLPRKVMCSCFSICVLEEVRNLSVEKALFCIHSSGIWIQLFKQLFQVHDYTIS